MTLHSLQLQRGLLLDFILKFTQQMMVGIVGRIFSAKFSKQNLTAISFYNNDFGFITSASGYAYVYSIAPKPAVFTVEAQLIDSTSAVFKAACKTYAFSGNLSFVFDTSPTFPNLNETFPQAIKSDSIVIASTGVINGLLPNTLYYLYSKLTIGGDVVGDTIRFYTDTLF